MIKKGLVTKQKKRIVVIGGGFGGLAAAALLAKQRHAVTVLEKNSELGGRARIWRQNNFQFDLGPSWYLMPEVFDHFFSLFGRRASDFYQLKRLDPGYRVFWGKGDYWDIPAEKESLFRLADQWEENGAEKLRDYLRRSTDLYRSAMAQFIYRDFHRVAELVDWNFLKALVRNRLYLSLEKYIQQTFTNPRMWRLLEYTMVFLGTSPRQAPAIYALMSHVDFNLGVWYPLGGIGVVVEAIRKLAEQQGVKIIAGAEVKKVCLHHGKIVSVHSTKGDLAADLVVANADYHYVETQLLPAEARSFSQQYWERRTLAPSTLLVYLGLREKLSGSLHHNLYFDEHWDEHFATIFTSPAWPRKYSYYVSVPSKTDPVAAPAGKENLFFLIPVASGLKDTESVRERYANRVVTHFSTLVGTDLAKKVEVRRIFSHRDFIQDYHACQGTALGLAHTLRQTAVFRLPHRSRKVSNLYYVGHYTHPGIGVPPVIVSAEIVVREVVEDVGKV